MLVQFSHRTKARKTKRISIKSLIVVRKTATLEGKFGSREKYRGKIIKREWGGEQKGRYWKVKQ